MRHLFFFMTLAIMIALSGCAAKPKPAQEPLTPMPEAAVLRDPDNTQFMRSVAEYIGAKGAPGNTQYEFTRLDLNGDGRREGLILLKSPHQYWCGFNGCNLVIFKAHNDGFEMLSEVRPVRGPLTVSINKTNGWRDIITKVSGRMHIESKDVALRFDGAGYPAHPAFEPPVEYAFNEISGVRIFP